MKKALAILMILALVGSAAFAEITFGAWGRGLFVPLQNTGADGAENMANIAKSWDNSLTNPRVGFSVMGNSDNVGFQIDIYADNSGADDNGSLVRGDQAKIWVKPMDKVTVTLGKFFDDTLRGNGTFGSFDWLRAYGGGEGEDFTFTRICSGDDNKNWNSEQGFEVAVKPTDAIFAAVAFCGLDKQATQTADLTDGMQIAGGYTIEGIGQIRAQYFSQYLATETAGEYDADGTVEVAFKLTAVENLYADFGFRMFTNSDSKNANDTKDINAYANYKVDAATIHVLVAYTLNATADDNAYNFGAGVDYNLDGGITLQGDVRYYNDIRNGGTDAKTTFFAGVKKGFSNGLIGAGFEYMTAGDAGYAIPVRLEYWF